MESFWLIWNPNGKAPTVQHDSEKAARTEAERLARCNPGHQFYILEAHAVCQIRDIVWEEVDLPF